MVSNQITDHGNTELFKLRDDVQRTIITSNQNNLDMDLLPLKQGILQTENNWDS